MSDPISGTGLAGGVLTGPASMDFFPEPITAWYLAHLPGLYFI